MSYKKICVICAACAALTLAIGCASRSHAPSPDELQARLDATRAEFRGLIASEIDDPKRAKTFAALSDERDSLISQHAVVVQRYSMTMKKLNSDYSSTRKDFDNLIQDYNRDRRASQAELLELMGKMKAATTEREWKILAKFELQELNPRTMAYSTEVN